MDQGSWVMVAVAAAALIGSIWGGYAILVKHRNPELVIVIVVGILALAVPVGLPVVNPRISVVETLLGLGGAMAGGLLVILLARVANRVFKRGSE